MSVRARIFLVVLLISLVPVVATAQNRGVRPLAANASLDETRKWLIEAIAKYASYSSRVSSAEVSNVRFNDCSMTIAMIRRTAAATRDTLGVRTRTRSEKQDIAFDLVFIEAGGIELSDHIFPQLKVIKIKFRSDASTTPSVLSPDHEIVVRKEAGEAVRDALLHAYKLCMNSE